MYPAMTPCKGGDLNPDGPKLRQVVLISAIDVDEKFATMCRRES